MKFFKYDTWILYKMLQYKSLLELILILFIYLYQFSQVCTEGTRL